MFTVFDLETTGLSTTSCDIIQFAYAMFDSNNQFVKAENLYFYYEGMSWSQDAADASHHLSIDFLKQYEDKFEENLLKMYSILNRANVCGHNAATFDCPFVKNWLSRMGLDDFQFGVIQDTMRAFKPITKRARIKLTKLTEMMGLSQQVVNNFADLWFGRDNLRSAHDAAYDVTATAMLTLMGLNKNLITFELPAQAAVMDYSAYMDAYADMEQEPVDKPIDPKGFIVKLVNTGNTEPEYKWINHDRDTYRELDVLQGNDNLSYLQSNPVLDVCLFQRDDGFYESREGSVTYECSPNCNCVRIKTPYYNVTDSEIDMLTLIEHNFGKRGNA